MRSPFQSVTVVLIFVCSLVLSMLVLERCGSFVNYVRLYGVSGRFFLNKELTLLAGCVGVVGFLSGAALHRSTVREFFVRRHFAVISMYMNGIALISLFLMAMFPVVHFS